MSEQQEVLNALVGKRVTAVRIGEILGVTEKTARKRLADGLNASDVITICRSLGANPVEALVKMEFITLAETMAFVDSDGELLATADENALLRQLADRVLTTAQLADMIAARAELTEVLRERANRPRKMKDLLPGVSDEEFAEYQRTQRILYLRDHPDEREPYDPIDDLDAPAWVTDNVQHLPRRRSVPPTPWAQRAARDQQDPAQTGDSDE